MKKLNLEKLGTRLRALRESRGLSGEQLADRLGIASHTYYRYERGEAENIPFEVVIRLAVEYGIPVDAIAALGEAIEVERLPDDPLEQLLRNIRNLLGGLPENQRKRMITFFNRLTRELTEAFSKETAEETASSLSELPDWFRKQYAS